MVKIRDFSDDFQGVASQGVIRYLDASARGPLAAIPAGEWCNGNTAVFGTVILGSSPSSPANLS